MEVIHDYFMGVDLLPFCFTANGFVRLLVVLRFYSRGLEVLLALGGLALGMVSREFRVHSRLILLCLVVPFT